MSYCDPSDLYAYGLPRGSLSTVGRLVDSVDTSADTLELNNHGFADDDVVQLRAVGGGSLPTPLSEGTDYYAIAASEWAFQLAASAGGAAIDITAAGTTFKVLSALPVAAVISKVSRQIDDMLPAHVVPLTDPVPDIVRVTAAELAASELLAYTGGLNEPLSRVYDTAMARLQRWAKNSPIRDANATASAQLAFSGTSRSSSPWRQYGGTL